jgi:hypothetical protein
MYIMFMFICIYTYMYIYAGLFGFKYHRAEDDCAYLLLWLPKETGNISMHYLLMMVESSIYACALPIFQSDLVV